MEGPALVPLQPGADLGVLVGGVVVENAVDQLTGGHRGLDRIEETDELLVPMPGLPRALEQPATMAATLHEVASELDNDRSMARAVYLAVEGLRAAVGGGSRGSQRGRRVGDQ